MVRDFRAELWPSMDLCADELLAHIPATVSAADITPAFRHVFGYIPCAPRAAFNADRLLNRHVLLPRVVRRISRRFDFFHIVDHSYAHLVNVVPTGRAGVYCHDLDAFRSILEPNREPRPWWFRRLAARTLGGLKCAAVVFHNSAGVSRQLVDAGIINANRLVHAPLGVSAEFAPLTSTPVELPFTLPVPFLLHVGSNIPRKRLDVLLRVFAEFRRRGGRHHLVQVGGPWPTHLVEHITALGVSEWVTQVRGLARLQLAELYRRAATVLVTSEAEGFGLPVIEALACGTPVVASDLPTLREAGGTIVNYCTVADTGAWLRGLGLAIREPRDGVTYEKRVAQAARFSWREHARIIAATYQRLADGGR